MTIDYSGKCPVCIIGELSVRKHVFGSEAFCNNSSCKASFKEKGKGKMMFIGSEYPMFGYVPSTPMTANDWEMLYCERRTERDKRIKEEERRKLLENIRSGRFDQISIVKDTMPLLLGKDETCYRKFQNVKFYEDVGSGFSEIRRNETGKPPKPTAQRPHEKGLTLANRQEWKVVDSGALFVTNERLVFFGEHHNIELPLVKLLSITPFSDAVGIWSSGKQRTEYYADVDGETVCAFVEALRKVT